jgi:hypothetical protein
MNLQKLEDEDGDGVRLADDGCSDVEKLPVGPVLLLSQTSSWPSILFSSPLMCLRVRTARVSYRLGGHEQKVISRVCPADFIRIFDEWSLVFSEG